jgi:2-aminoadipate transaminase
MTSSLRLSRRAADLHASPIRDILAVVSRPGMVSFAGGLPAAETFPDFSLAAVPREAAQYGASEGDWALRERVAADLAERDLPVPPTQVLILSGSQQGIDLVAKLFVDPGTPVAVETPTYLAALQVFRFFGARFVGFSAQDHTSLVGARPTVAYVNPTFQNPTGYCYTADERAALAATCERHGIVLFEDDPYRDLCYEACARRPLCANIAQGSWIYQGSFSKSLAPGLRLGYLACSPDLLPLLTHLKQAADLHSNRLSQALVLQALDDPARAVRSARLNAFYRERRDGFAALLDQHFGDLADWRLPAGGLFFWLQLRHERASLDTRALLPRALERQVAFMPGEPFFASEHGGRGCLRLNFSHAAPEAAARGLAALAAVVREAG